MVTILEDAPRKKSFLEKLSQGVSGGITSGLDTAMQLRGERTKKLAEIPKAASRVSKQFKSLALQDPSEFIKFQKSVGDLVDQGYSPDDAALLAYQNYTKSEEAPISKEVSYEDKLKGRKSEVEKNLMKQARVFSSAADVPGQFINLLKGATQEATGANKVPERIREAQAGPFGGTIPAITDWYDKLTGGQGKPENLVEELNYGIPFGAPGILGVAAGKVAEGLGLPHPIQTGAEFLSFMLTHRAMPKGAAPLSEGSKAVLKRAEKVSASTGESVESVLDRAAAESGVDFTAVAAGDAQSTQALNESLSRQVKSVSELKKRPFAKESEIARREKTAESLERAPLEEYYDIEKRAKEKEVAKSPEKAAQEKIRNAELSLSEKDLMAQHHQFRDRLRKPGLGHEEKRLLKKSIDDTEKALSDLRYEKKHGRTPPTDAETRQQIETSLERLRSEAANPTPEGQKKIARDLKNDEKYLEHFEKVLERGTISQDFNPDTYLKMNEKYLRSYQDAILKERELMKEMSSEAKLKSKRFVDYLEGRVKGLQAKIVRQAEKIKAMKALEKPSGAFYKNMIKQTRKDLKQFKKDFFTSSKRVMGIENAKTRSVAKKAFSERMQPNPKVEKASEEVYKNPSRENIDKVAEETGMSPKETKKKVEEAKTILKKGEPVSEKLIDKLSRWLTKSAIIGTPTSFLVGIVSQWVNEEFYDGKSSPVNTQKIITLLARLTDTRVGGFAKEGRDVVRTYFEGVEADKLKSLPPGQRDEYYRKIFKNRGSASAKRIREKMNEAY